MGDAGGPALTGDLIPARLAVVGLGYVGLPLAVAFSRHVPTTGFDVDNERIRELAEGFDRNAQLSPQAITSEALDFTSDEKHLADADFVVVTVPTPVDEAKRPDMTHLVDASRIVGRALAAGPTPRNARPIVVYESTVYPGCTEEECVPVLEEESGLVAGIDFAVGYSPERTNFGDEHHTLEDVVKVVAGQDVESADVIEATYRLVAHAGVHRAPDIQTAEAAKVIENVQRDLNIALMNELAMLFDRMGLDSRDVFAAARTKWNFLPFEPGLVGGHCIPVDPYYLTYKAAQIGYQPEVILAGRRINDSMAFFVADQTLSLIERGGGSRRGARILILGIAFKPDINDVRSTQVKVLAERLKDAGAEVAVHDPMVGEEKITALGLRAVADPFAGSANPKSGDDQYDAVILAVPHLPFRERPAGDYLNLLERGGADKVLIDLHRVLDVPRGSLEHVLYWGL